MKVADPIALINKYEIERCRECGEHITAGTEVWWIKTVGSAHRTCGWTTAKGKIHPATKSSIKDIPAVRKISATKENAQQPLFQRNRERFTPRNQER